MNLSIFQVQALYLGVQDSNVHVQRSSLDLLLIGFPLHETELAAEDMRKLVTGALTALLRRDVSLNRRLYDWLLGSEFNMAALPADHAFVKRIADSEESRAAIYFDLFSKDLFVEVRSGLQWTNPLILVNCVIIFA